MIYQAGIFYHASLMDEYRIITWRDFKTEKEAEEWANKWLKEHLPKPEPDPENPISDLYDVRIQELEEN